jgi:long-chain fatty acid transport protein
MNDSNRLARVPDMNRIWASFGASYDVSKTSKMHLGYAHLFTTGGSITDGSGAANGGGVLTGSYTGSVDIVNASYEMKF